MLQQASQSAHNVTSQMCNVILALPSLPASMYSYVCSTAAPQLVSGYDSIWTGRAEAAARLRKVVLCASLPVLLLGA